MTGLKAAFATFGAKGRNQRWSWSARSDDGKTVVLALWKDQFDYTSRPVAYDTIGRPDLPGWTDALGNRERIENLVWARDHCDGMFSVVIAVAEDVSARPRSISVSYPHKTMKMKLLDLNETTGEFRAINVDG